VKWFRVAVEGSFVITASFLVVLATATLTIKVWGWNSGIVANWVQAVGSILAIGGAYFVGERQARATLLATQEAHRLGEHARREGMFSVIKAAHSRAKQIEAALDDDNPPLKMIEVYHPSLVDSLIDLMAKLPISELGSDLAINSFIKFSGQFVFLSRNLDLYIGGPYADPKLMKEIATLKQQGCPEHVERVVATKKAVLKKNVQVHLNSIETEFRNLMVALQKDA
jgi:hypothetical protein